MTSLESEIAALYTLAHELLYLGMDDTPIYSDYFTRLNRDVFQKANGLCGSVGATAEEEASLCLSLLMGYNATLYNDGDKQERVQSILERCWKVLDQLPPSLLKVRLLTYCYGEVYDEELLSDARTIIGGWHARGLSEEEQEISELLDNLEKNQCAWSEVNE